MKKILMMIVIAAIGTLAMMAQTNKGQFLISGSTDLSYTTTSMTLEYDGETIGSSDLSSFNMSPSVVYFVADDFALGFVMSIENSKQDDDATNNLTVGPMAKYYAGGTTHLRPYLYAAYLFGSSTEEDDEEVAKAKATAWEIGGGAAIFLNDFASIDITLGYGKATFISRDDEKAKILAKALAVNVGFSLYF